MTELWESAVEEQAEVEMEEDPDVQESEAMDAEMQEAEVKAPAVEQAAKHPAALTVSVDDFAALEERVLRAVTLVKQERQARLAAEERAAGAESGLREQTLSLEKMAAELAALKTERDQVRQRVERLLQQLDTLEI